MAESSTLLSERGASGGSRDFAFTDRDFTRVRDLIYRQAGIALSDSKREMVYSRLVRILRSRRLDSFSTYLDLLQSRNDPADWEAFTNALTTNLTAFFREAHHFPILADLLRGRTEPISLWCSASSTGEEPYSMAMTLVETFRTMTPRAHIIATDVDTNVLAKAEAGVYAADRVEKLSESRLRQFFMKGSGNNDGLVRVRPELRQLITFQRLNLLDASWALKGPFDAIFCRNVMIYFDKPTQAQILDKFVPLLKPDGLLFAGHSENFTYATHAFQLRGKTVYELSSQVHCNKGATAQTTRAAHHGHRTA